MRRYIAENLPALKDLPVLSAAAPFKLGFGGSTDFTAIDAGPLAIRNAADLYLYPNTLTAVKLDGAELKAWLEKSATLFQPHRSRPRDAPGTGQPQGAELQLRRDPGRHPLRHRHQQAGR